MDIKLRRILAVIVILNTFDCFSTLYGCINNYIIELNPITNVLIEKNIYLFLFFKFITTLFIILAFGIKNKEVYLLKLRGGKFLCIVLGIIFVLHLKWIFTTLIINYI